MAELYSLTVREMREGLLSRKFSAVELTESMLQRVEATNPQLNSFITVCGNEARGAARQADERLRSDGERTPVLTGIPVAVKDMLLTKGVRTTCASKILGDFIPPYDCTAVLRLKRDGAVIIGKTNLDEFAMGSSTEHSAFGPTKNPWDHSRVPGGSSGGSAAAVAVGQAPIALGTDTGGSVRQPASLSGIVGLKPTYGRVSRYGAVAYASSFDQIGPFGRTVEDVAHVMRCIAGHDEHDSTSMAVPVDNYPEEMRYAKDEKAPLAGIRVGVPKEYMISGMQPEVEKSFHTSVQVMKSLGAEIVDISLPHTDYALAIYYIIVPAEASSNLARYDGVRFGYRASGIETLGEMYERTRAEGFGAEVKRRILIGSYVLSKGYYDAYYRKAQQVRTLIINDFRAAFHNHCDVIAAPVSPTTAFRIGEKTNSPLEMYLADVFTVPINLAGVPAISVPSGVDGQGLPIGLQLIGAPFSEKLLLRVGHQFERAVNFVCKPAFGS